MYTAEFQVNPYRLVLQRHRRLIQDIVLCDLHQHNIFLAGNDDVCASCHGCESHHEEDNGGQVVTHETL